MQFASQNTVIYLRLKLHGGSVLPLGAIFFLAICLPPNLITSPNYYILDTDTDILFTSHSAHEWHDWVDWLQI